MGIHCGPAPGGNGCGKASCRCCYERPVPCTPATFRWQIDDVPAFEKKRDDKLWWDRETRNDWFARVMPPKEPGEAACCARCGGVLSVLPFSSRRLSHNLCECEQPLPPARPPEEIRR